MTLLFTSPLVNPIIVTLFWVTFGFELTVLYTGMALSMSISVSWLMDRAGFERHLRSDLVRERAPAVSVSLATLQPASAAKCCDTGDEQPVTVALDTRGIGVAQPGLPLSESFG